MRIVYFANGSPGLNVLRVLQELDEQIVGLVLHPPDTRTLGDDILRESSVGPEAVFDASQLSDPATL